jgi:hypothetical protein
MYRFALPARCVQWRLLTLSVSSETDIFEAKGQGYLEALRIIPERELAQIRRLSLPSFFENSIKLLFITWRRCPLALAKMYTSSFPVEVERVTSRIPPLARVPLTLPPQQKLARRW